MVKPSLGPILLAIFIILVIFSTQIAGLITDYWWFSALGFSEIFLIGLKTKIFLFFLVAATFFIFTFINVRIAGLRKHGRYIYAVMALVSVLLGMTAPNIWLLVQQYLNQSSFGLTDPIFMKDVAYYLFSLPVLSLFVTYLQFIIVLAGLFVAFIYFRVIIEKTFKTQVNPDGTVIRPDFKRLLKSVKNKAYTHLAVLVALFFVLIAVKNYLSQFSVVYSQGGVVTGAGYTDVFVVIPVLKALMIAAGIISVLFIVWTLSKKVFEKKHILLYTVLGYFILSFIGLSVLPLAVQEIRVSPNELTLERPYISHNINYTPHAYGLDEVSTFDYNMTYNLTREKIDKNPETIDNVRVLDLRPLKSTYQQTQEIRLYYDLSNIDIDRYNIGGKERQVLISAREMDQDKIADNAKTWVNLHMVYTHGYGVVMSPVNKVTESGLPEYMIKDIPPVYTVNDTNIRMEKPQIYYGENDNPYVLVNSKVDEFDYPKGESNEYINYDGKGGIRLDSFFKKVLFALRFTDFRILLSSNVDEDTRVMYRKNIVDRIKTITPFIRLDNDPYIVIHEGRLKWIVDGYTVHNRFPYSATHNGFNYIRNSLKIVVDAYDGDITYYITDEKDPLIQTYNNIFPSTFTPISDMDEGLREHVRYPVDLFRIQSKMYQDYHMENPGVFYNKEDAWEIPSEIYGTGQRVQVEPYYNIMQLPGEDSVQFVLLNTYTPIRKDNMIGWLGGLSEGENYGKLILYRFPKDKLVFGPLQIEAKFDQDSEISEQLTLWSQRGSQVTRGNLLVIPIGDSLLYIEPLYIQAETGQLPELKRILVSDGERVVMEQTLGQALNALFGETKEPEEAIDTNLIGKANNLYNSMVNASRSGNWSQYGTLLEELGKTLGQLESVP
ncbi:MAG: UPF0182 family protein [Candidatus Woesearchaeota archaeon]